MLRSLRAALLGSVFAAPAFAQATKPLITPKDFGKWEQLGTARLSPKGDWVAYGVTKVSEESELRLRGGPRDTTIVVPFAGLATFTGDGKWVSYAIGVSPKERERLTKEKKPIRNTLEIRNIASGNVTTIPEISGSSFSPDGRFIAMTRYAADGKRTSETLVQELATGSRLLFSNIAEQSWADAGSLLAMTIETDGGAGNGVQLYDAVTGVVRSLDSHTAVYRGLTWRAKSMDLAVLRMRPMDKEFRDTSFTLLAWQNIASPEPTALQLDPASSATFPAKMRIADYRRPAWSRDGRVLYFGVRPREAVADAIKKSDDKVSDVEIWHTNDVRMLPQQKASEATDLRRTLLTAWRVGDNKVVQLGKNIDETTTALNGDRYATETDRSPYAWGTKFGRFDQDIWIVDATTGERKKILEKVRHYFGSNPAGTKLTWSDGKDFWVVDIASGAKTNLTAALTSSKKADFVNHEDDHPNNVAPVIFPAGWAKGDVYLLNDTYDVWSVALDGSGGKRLTDGAKEGVVHRLITMAPFTASPEERAFDLSKPMLVSLSGKNSKKSGWGRLDVSGTVTRLVFDDAAYSGLQKADSATVYAFTRQRYDESPNLHVGADIANAKTVAETNLHQKDYAWSKVELFDFKSTIGVPLQAMLYYPANYDPSKKYPMIVYTYEKLTQDLHRYVVPRETDYYNTTVFTQNGYFVLQPDIVFRPREPGIGAQQSVEAAVKTVLARGFVDPARVGHVGHSQGGYEAAFLGTHSKMFATTVVGSGITDMISFAGQLHWQGGSAEFDHWETGQFRMEVAPWEDFKAMLDNSPLATVQTMTTKAMLLEVGSEDGTVDSRQGSLFYNYARRAGKNVVMLMYPGEGHGLAKKENQVDYEKRILQWFAYYLKGETPAKWITEGQTALERKAIMDANK